MLDIHTHLYWKSYDMDRDAVVARAREVGVTKMICVGTEPEDNPLAIEIAEKYEDIFASVGIHPHFFNDYAEKQFPTRLPDGQVSNFQFPNKIKNPESKIINQSEEKKSINELVVQLKRVAQSSNRVIAIGECGLDYYSHQLTDNNQRKIITGEQKKLQKEGFLAQLELAGELGLPLIIHTRPSVGSIDAYEDVFEILRDTKYMIPNTILHCYQGDTEITKKFLELPNIYFSFAGNITYPVKKAFVGTKDDPMETVKLVPLPRLFVETDCPFLAPQSKRGQRNEPAFVCETAGFLASVKGISGAELDKIVTKNAEKVFWNSY